MRVIHNPDLPGSCIGGVGVCSVASVSYKLNERKWSVNKCSDVWVGEV
jgi:hypothetical protein